jgi:hypothetical protein
LESYLEQVKQKLAKNKKKYTKQTDLLDTMQQKHAQQGLEYSILQVFNTFSNLEDVPTNHITG